MSEERAVLHQGITVLIQGNTLFPENDYKQYPYFSEQSYTA